MNGISFSLLRESTFEAATELCRLLPQLSATPHPFDENMLACMLSQPRTLLYVVWHEGHIAGMLTLVGYVIPTGEKWQLEDVVLDCSLRGQGIARRFMAWVIDDFRTCHPHVKVYLTSRPNRVAANALYQSLGFVKKETNNYVF